MEHSCLVALMAIMILAGTVERDVFGQSFPTKPIRIVTAGVGASSDIAARLIAQAISGGLGQQVIVDNRGSGVVPGEIVSQSPPDGYTLLVYGAPFWIMPLLQKTPYDPVKDFLPITILVRQPNVLVVHPSLPVKSVRELIALAKAKPDMLNYGSLATGGSTHLAAELFKFKAGVRILRVPYRSGSMQQADLLSGQIHMAFGTGATITPNLRSGRLKGLAVTSLERSPLFPDLPTMAASGVPGYEYETMTGFFAPANTPKALMDRLNQETVQALHNDVVKQRFFASGVETWGISQEQAATTIRSEIAKIGKLIKDAHITAE